VWGRSGRAAKGSASLRHDSESFCASTLGTRATDVVDADGEKKARVPPLNRPLIRPPLDDGLLVVVPFRCALVDMAQGVSMWLSKLLRLSNKLSCKYTGHYTLVNAYHCHVMDMVDSEEGGAGRTSKVMVVPYAQANPHARLLYDRQRALPTVPCKFVSVHFPHLTSIQNYNMYCVYNIQCTHPLYLEFTLYQ
jgi:hypothetical protein